MGSQESKVLEAIERDVEGTQNGEKAAQVSIRAEGVPSTPILTPLGDSPLDPRSPSLNIARTPLQGELEPEIDQPDDEAAAAEDIPGSPRVILGVDPRSPTIAFERTPIVLEMLPKSHKPHNKNLDNVRRTVLLSQTTPPKFNPGDSTPQKPPGLTPFSSSVANKRKSLVGLLETNIDFTETNLDEAYQIRSRNNTPQKAEEAASVEVDLGAKNEKEEAEVEEKEADETLENEPEEAEAEVEEEADESGKKGVVLEETINVTAHVKNFDRKLTNLIYEDVGVVSLSPKSKELRIRDRTPLGLRNTNSKEPKKSATKLKVSDRPRKSEPSRIPVFKRAQGVQCENTPPRGNLEALRGPRRHNTQWDADKTLVI